MTSSGIAHRGGYVPRTAPSIWRTQELEQQGVDLMGIILLHPVARVQQPLNPHVRHPARFRLGDLRPHPPEILCIGDCAWGRHSRVKLPNDLGKLQDNPSGGGVGSDNWYRFDKKGTKECHSVDVRYLHCSGLLRRRAWFFLRWLRAGRETGSICGGRGGHGDAGAADPDLPPPERPERRLGRCQEYGATHMDGVRLWGRETLATRLKHWRTPNMLSYETARCACVGLTPCSLRTTSLDDASILLSRMID